MKKKNIELLYKKQSKGKTGYKAKKRFELAARRKKVALLYLRKMNGWEIAKTLEVSHAVVHTDIKHLEKTWLEQSKQEIDKHRAKALAVLSVLEIAAWKKDDLLLVLRVLQEQNKINGIYPIERFEGKITGGMTLLSAIKHAIIFGNNDGDVARVADAEYKRLS